MSSKQDSHELVEIPYAEEKSPVHIDRLCQQFQQLVEHQNRRIDALEDAGTASEDKAFKQVVVGVIAMGSFMASVAVALMSYANDLSEKEDKSGIDGNELNYDIAQYALVITFEYNLAVVTIAILVPLLRMRFRKEPGSNKTMLSWLGWMLFAGLVSMFVAFYLLLKARFSTGVSVAAISCFVLTVFGAVLGVWCS
ncbi:hypothetical protein BDV93DRAFT_611664 [Ceratobasidium sp. AG-I]|nr:hypothetical protein BDV93DRAFT_611664 [Ceratobasidium sp. AG-I]